MKNLSENSRGAVLMTASMAGFTFNDACMKLLFGSIPLFQALFLRGGATFILMIALAKWWGVFKLDLPARDWTLIFFRTIGEVGAAYFFLTALFNMPIANVTAILQVLPLTVTLASVFFLRESVGWKRFLAIFVGFCGVMLIVRPGSEGFNSYALYALIAVGFITMRDITVRRMSHKTPSIMVAIAAALGVTLFAGVGTMSTQWVEMDLSSLMLLGASTIFIMAGYLFSVMVMRVGDISFVAPFRYTGLLWALLLGLIVFGEWPDPLTFIGSAVVVATGIFSFYREREVAKELDAARRRESE